MAQAAGVGGGIGGHLSLLSPRVTPHSRRGSALSSKSVSRAGSLSRTSGADTAATVAGLGEAVAFLQGEIDDAVMARGAVHARSWKYPTACAAEIDIHSILERYAFVGRFPFAPPQPSLGRVLDQRLPSVARACQGNDRAASPSLRDGMRLE